MFELRVTDNVGATATDNINITVQAASAPNQSPVANAGNDVSIQLPVNQVLLNGCSSYDPEGTALRFKWRKISGPASFQVINDAVCQADIRGLTQGVYRFELAVTDAGNLTATDLVDVAVLAASTQGGSARTMRVNIFGGSNPYNNTQWNNWNVVNSLTSTKFNYDDGAVSNINAVLSDYGLIADNGNSYASGATACPQQVLRYTSANTSYRTLVFNGMSTSKTYTLEFYAGRTNSGNKTVLQIGNRYDTISTDNNLNDVARFTNLTPDNNGRITATISRIGTWNYLSGFTITESSNTSSARSAGITTAETTAVENTIEPSNEPSNSLVAYPNPVNDMLYLRIPGNVSGAYKISIVNINGKTMLQRSGIKGSSAFADRIDVKELPKGTYLLRLSCKDTQMTSRIIKL